jgi:hypothetical protein
MTLDDFGEIRILMSDVIENMDIVFFPGLESKQVTRTPSPISGPFYAEYPEDVCNILFLLSFIPGF